LSNDLSLPKASFVVFIDDEDNDKGQNSNYDKNTVAKDDCNNDTNDYGL
jgi:hypothetical protein